MFGVNRASQLISLFSLVESFIINNKFPGGSTQLFFDPRTLNVDLGDRSYPIYIGENLLENGPEIRRHIKSKKALIVTNTVVGPLYSKIVRENLEKGGIEVSEVTLPDGEEFKTFDVMMKIIDKAMEEKLDRKSVFIALGGGVIGDTAGFAAAIYQRGVKFIQIPTTLMAMVDSAVGGKTAVNHPLGKNMIGAFYQPECVIADIATLNTLPDREFISGVSEVIKYGLIRDPEFFIWQENNMASLLNRNAASLSDAIYLSCVNKAAVVAADEKEAGVRATLNLGHTFGHAIEAGLGYGTWLHGEAVGAGISMATDLSLKQGLIDSTLAARIKKLLISSGLPIDLRNPFAQTEVGEKAYTELLSGLTKDKFLDLMSMDKKVSNGQLNLILLSGALGTSIITDKFDPQLLDSVLDDYLVPAEAKI